MESTIDGHILNWIENIRHKWLSDPKESKPFDIGKRIHYLTVDIITDLALGKPLGYVADDKDTYDLMTTIKAGNMICQHFSVIHELNTIFYSLAKLPIVRGLVLPSATDEKGLGKIMGVWPSLHPGSRVTY